jgi:acyl carrier protein
MTDSKVETIRLIVAEILGADPHDLTEESGVDVTKGWDSLQNLVILMAIEEEFGHQFSPADMTEIKTIQAVANRLP